MASRRVLNPLQLVSQAVLAELAAYWPITMPNTVKQMNATTTPSMTRPAASDIFSHPLVRLVGESGGGLAWLASGVRAWLMAQGKGAACQRDVEEAARVGC